MKITGETKNDFTHNHITNTCPIIRRSTRTSSKALKVLDSSLKRQNKKTFASLKK